MQLKQVSNPLGNSIKTVLKVEIFLRLTISFKQINIFTTIYVSKYNNVKILKYYKRL